MHRVALSLAFIGISMGFVAIGCGADTKNQTSSGSPTQGVSLENASGEMAKVFCGIIFSCCDMAELSEALKDFNPPPTTQAECEATFKPAVEVEIFAALKDGVAAGRLAYDPEKASACFAKVNGECSTFKENIFGNDETCKTVFTGKVADGGDCLQDLECAQAGSGCLGAMDPMLGKCTPLPKENEACPDFTCAPGLVCSASAMSVCIQPKTDGTACNIDFECASGYCDSSLNACAAKKALGEACSSPFACKDGYCDQSTTVCTAKKTVGEACMSFDECVTGECNDMKMCAAPMCDGQ